jgi:hypothetical protein
MTRELRVPEHERRTERRNELLVWLKWHLESAYVILITFMALVRLIDTDSLNLLHAVFYHSSIASILL